MIWWCLVMFQVKATSFVLWEPQSISHFADRMHRTIWWNLDDPSLNFASIADVSRNVHLQTDKPDNKPLFGNGLRHVFLVKVGTFMGLPDHFNERHIRIFVGHLISPLSSPENCTTGRYIMVYPHVGSLGYRISQRVSASKNPSLAQRCAVHLSSGSLLWIVWGNFSLPYHLLHDLFRLRNKTQGSPSGDLTTKNRDLII